MTTGVAALLSLLALSSLVACTSPDGEPGASCEPSGRSIIDVASARVQQAAPSLTKPTPQDGCSGADGYSVRFYVSDRSAARDELASIGCRGVQLRDAPGESWRCGSGSEPWVVLFDDAPGVAELTLL